MAPLVADSLLSSKDFHQKGSSLQKSVTSQLRPLFFPSAPRPPSAPRRLTPKTRRAPGLAAQEAIHGREDHRPRGGLPRAEGSESKVSARKLFAAGSGNISIDLSIYLSMCVFKKKKKHTHTHTEIPRPGWWGAPSHL